MKKRKLPEIKKPIFIIGCCNSGTTILRDTLLQDGGLNGPSIDNHDLDGMPPIMTHHVCNDTFRLWAHPKFQFCNHYTEDDYNEDDAAQVKRVFSQFVLNGERLIAKSPADTLRARLIQAYFPDAYFIAIVRNGYAVSEGIVRKRKYDPERPQYGSHFTTIEEAAEQWLRANIMVLSMQKYLQRYLIIQYEDLVNDPERALHEVLDFCQIEKAEFSIPTFETNHNHKQAVRLSEGDGETITRIAQPMLLHFGYKLFRKELRW
ncbi:MAG: sulfotransferase family protein [Candidatus Kerfeldbacteria bacterium]|jgi:sulfotransferase family protein